MRPHVSLPSPPDRVRPRMPLSDHMYMHMYSSETAYTNQNISHTLRHAEGFARHDPSRLSCITGFNNSLRAGTCIAPIAPQPSVPPSDRRMPPSDPTKRLRTRSPPSTARPAGRHPCRSAQPTPRQSRSTRTHSTDPRPASLSTALRHGHSLAVSPPNPNAMHDADPLRPSAPSPRQSPRPQRTVPPPVWGRRPLPPHKGAGSNQIPPQPPTWGRGSSAPRKGPGTQQPKQASQKRNAAPAPHGGAGQSGPP